MKIHSSALLAVCVLYPHVWGTDAFAFHGPSNVKSLALNVFGYDPMREAAAAGNSPSEWKPMRSANEQTMGNNIPEWARSIDAEVEVEEAPIETPVARVQPPPVQEKPKVMTPPVQKAAPKMTPFRETEKQPAKKESKDIWETCNPITVQGGSLRTWSTPDAERVQVLLKTEGRPLNANVELWHGPDNTPMRLGVYIEDGSVRPFNAVIETPRGQNAVAIRNTGQMEFPMAACLLDKIDSALVDAATKSKAPSKLVQGGAVQTFPFPASVGSVLVALRTDGRPLNARIELLQGPNNNKQVVEVYTEDGRERPFYMILETPGSGNVIRVVNTATVEFPMTISVEPYHIEQESKIPEARGWDNVSASRSDRQW